MAALTFSDIIKSFNPNHPKAGQLRLIAITEKIKNQESFQMNDGTQRVLRFADNVTAQAFRDKNLEKIADKVAGRTTPFVYDDDDGKEEYIGIRKLEKTAEFGGKGGGGAGPDPHELMTAALILKYGRTGKKAVDPLVYSTLDKAAAALISLKSEGGQVLSHNTKELSAFNNDFLNFAKAISAANGFLKDMGNGTRVKKVYQTGRVWDQLISKYRIDKHQYFGKKDYNSSDLVVQCHPAAGIETKFVGISLKKKGAKPKDPDPTVINKTVVGEDGLLKYLLFNEVAGMRLQLRELYRSRGRFFLDVIKAALHSSNPKIHEMAMQKLPIEDGSEVLKTAAFKNNKNENARSIGVANKKAKNIAAYLEKMEKFVKPDQAQVANILKDAQLLGQEQMTKALSNRWPPEKPLHSSYFQTFHELLTHAKVQKKLCIALLNIIFKLDLKKLIKDRGIHQEEFAFTLITGRGALENETTIVAAEAGVMPEEHSTSFLLDEITRRTTTYSFETAKGWRQPHEGGTAAKLKYALYCNANHIAEVELRYKGKIRNEPQFQAVITPDFKRLLKMKKNPDMVW